MKIGLFFGSFNPIHVGHLIIGQYFAQFTDLKQLWFVVSPHNPLKKKDTLAANHHRLNMVKEAIGNSPFFRVSDIEFNMPLPSYTIKTLLYLKDKYPDKEFVLIMGEDNLNTFHKWKNYGDILKHFKIYVYKRPHAEKTHALQHPHISLFDAPQMEISSSFIRNAISKQKDVSFFVPEEVYNYIKTMNLYGY